MIAYGSNDRPVSLDPFQNIVEVHWGAAPVVLVQMQATDATATIDDPNPFTSAPDDDAPAPPDVVIPHDQYADVDFYNPGLRGVLGRVNVYHVYVYKVGRPPSDRVVSNELGNFVQKSVLVNFKNAKTASVSVPGVTADIYAFQAFTDPPGTYITFHAEQVDAVITISAYPQSANFTPHEDGSISTDATPIWSIEETITPAIGTGVLTTLVFDKSGKVP